MATYNINKITLPSGDICKINASITSTDDDNGNVVLEGVDASSSTSITGISMNGTLLGTSGVINIPAASDSSAGIITTGAQTIAGNKTFKAASLRLDGTSSNGGLFTVSGAGLGPAIYLNLRDSSSSSSIHTYWIDTGTVSGGGFSFYEQDDSDPDNKYEEYYLPTVTGVGTYKILTTKSPVTIAQGGTGATTAENAKANLGLGTAAMNFRVQNLGSTAAQQWMLKNNVVNSSNSHYGNSTAICVTNNGIFLGEWDSSTYLGSIWSIQPNDYVTLSESQTITGTKTFTSNPTIKAGSQYTQLFLVPSDAVTDSYHGLLGLDTGSGTHPTKTQIYFGEKSLNSSTGALTNYPENYWLPAADLNRTSTANYDILTTKNTKTLTVSLTVAGWTTSHTQTVTVTGMTETAKIVVSAAPASEVNYRHSGVYCSAQAADTLTFTCTTNPTSALTVQILMIG